MLVDPEFYMRNNDLVLKVLCTIHSYRYNAKYYAKYRYIPTVCIEYKVEFNTSKFIYTSDFWLEFIPRLLESDSTEYFALLNNVSGEGALGYE